MPNAAETFVRDMIDMLSIVRYLDMPDDMKKKIEEHYDMIAKFGLIT